MTDHFDRVSPWRATRAVEHLPDLKERHALLLMASQPKRGAFTERRLASASFLRLAFHAEEAFLLDADKVCERLLAVREVSTNALGAGNAGGHNDHARGGWVSGSRTPLFCHVVAKVANYGHFVNSLCVL